MKDILYNNLCILPGKHNNVHWLNERTIVSISRNQLFFWTLEYERRMLRYKINRDRNYFCNLQDIAMVACPPNHQEIWLCRNNRQIEWFNAKTGKASASYGTVAFGVRAMAECPDDMNKYVEDKPPYSTWLHIFF